MSSLKFRAWAWISDSVHKRARSMARVLIAEDEPNLVVSREFLLKDAGYEVAIANDGGSALQLVKRFRPDLVLLDLMLPLVNGFEVCRQIRADPGWQSIKILMLTARGRPREIENSTARAAMSRT